MLESPKVLSTINKFYLKASKNLKIATKDNQQETKMYNASMQAYVVGSSESIREDFPRCFQRSSVGALEI